jgi:hypothetical protein
VGAAGPAAGKAAPVMTLRVIIMIMIKISYHNGERY